MGLLSVVSRKRHWVRDQRVVLPLNTCVALGKPLDLPSLQLHHPSAGKGFSVYHPMTRRSEQTAFRRIWKERGGG